MCIEERELVMLYNISDIAKGGILHYLYHGFIRHKIVGFPVLRAHAQFTDSTCYKQAF